MEGESSDLVQRAEQEQPLREIWNRQVSNHLLDLFDQLID